MQEGFENRLSDFVEEEDDCILALIKPFSLTEQSIPEMLSDYRWN